MSTFSWRVLRLPLLITLLWGLLLFTLFRWTAQREDEYTTGLARIQTATLFSSIVDTRDWNANNGGVWVREHPGCPANPWLPEEERTLRAEGGTTLVKVNPAYMTRQIAESFTSTLASFRISSEASGKPGRSVGNRGPALFRKGQARAFRSRFRQGGYALPLYGRPARQGKLHPVPSGQEGRRRARRHQRIHLRRAPFCSGDRTQAHHRARIRDHRDHRHGGDRRGHVPDQPQEGACRSRQPHQERLPRQHDPRYAYPADRHPRHDRTAGTRNAGFASPLSARQPPEGHRQPAYGRRRHHALFTA